MYIENIYEEITPYGYDNDPNNNNVLDFNLNNLNEDEKELIEERLIEDEEYYEEQEDEDEEEEEQFSLW